MAQLAPNPPTERISHLLPTVKCSSCTQPVPLDQLGDHVCPPASSNLASDTKPILPPVKAQTAPRPSSNASTRNPIAILFPRERRPSAAAAANNPRGASPTPSLSRSVPPSRAPSRSGARSPAISLKSNFIPQPPRPPSRNTQTPRPDPTPNVVFPSIPRHGGSAPSPLDTRSSILRRPSNPQSPPDAPSPIRRRPSNPQSAIDSRSPVQRRPSIPRPSLDTRSPIQRRPSAPQSPPDALSPIRRRPSNPQSPLETRSSVQRRPSIPQPPRETRSPIQRRPSAPQSPPSILRRPSDSRSQFAQTSNYGTSGDPRSALTPQSNHHPVRAVTSPTPSSYSSKSSVSPDIDTKSGGTAGMAGVGRRGFAAAAHAMLASPTSRVQLPAADMPAPRVPLSSFPQTTDDYRVNTPPLGTLDSPIAPPMPYSRRTPSHSSSVRSPPRNRNSRSSSHIPLSQSRASSPTPPPHEHSKASSIPFPVKPSDTFKSSNASGPLTPITPIGQRFSSEKASQKKAILPGGAVKVVTQDDANQSVLGRPSEDEGSEFSGLAYAEGDHESDDDELLARGMVSARVHHSPSVSSAYSDNHPPTERASTEIGLDNALAALLRSPTSTDTPLSPTSTKHTRASKPPMRSLTSHVQRDTPAQGAAAVRRGATISGAYSGPSDILRNDRSSQELAASGLARRREKVLTCLRCSKDIEDKRWISVENGRGVLCDKCWKNMYLPKCRRCNLPIEKQAVSSSDGQLKGKYHRDCFNCHTCHKPFPDKTFYVFDGKPFCDYHYHEANNSLCAAPDCGRPIEGPCAVSHTGDRYHAEHLTCEYEDDRNGEKCADRLVDYWEIEGRMLCERHMRWVVERDMMGVGLDKIGTSSDARAMKRRTRFIDLAGLR